jgi:hypothetical protein
MTVGRKGVAYTAGGAILLVLAFAFVFASVQVASPLVAEDAPTITFQPSEDVVFDWSEDACEPEDTPDLPARAFRDAEGRVQLILAHYVNRRLVGPDLNHLQHDCAVVMSSDRDRNPATFNGWEWIAAPYTLDGRTIFALVHNEFHGHRDRSRCRSGEYERCVYTSLSLAVSRDGGRTYRQRRAPTHLVATYPYRYVADSGPIGIFEPSNIVYNRRDRYYYALAHTVGHGNTPRGTCVLRTRRLGDPGSWRAWDGAAFSVRFVNPYQQIGARSRARVCRPVARAEIVEMSHSLTFNTYLGRFLLVGMSGAHDPARGEMVWGFYYSLSDDLVHWTQQKLLMEAELPWTHKCRDADPVAYPSLLDPASRSRSFETTGPRPYLYFTRFNYKGCAQSFDRDLVRVAVEISK